MIVRWGIERLPELVNEIGGADPLVVTTRRWQGLELPGWRRFEGVRSHAPEATVEAATRTATDADLLVGIGGGSAIDTAKAVSAATGLPVVSVPTTYAGAEWAASFGMLDEQTGRKVGGSGAHLAGIVYEPRLTLGLPPGESAGTALNALAHCAEALYVQGRTDEGDRHALAGAALIDEWLPRVLEDGSDLDARMELLRGACHAGAALGASGLALGHAMAQALGGRYGLPHGALNAICLPAALRFNQPVARAAIERLGEAMGTADAIGRVEELATLRGFRRLRDLGVPEDELADVAEATAERRGAKANPRPANPGEIEQLLRSVW